jgi:hypothetical protein
MTERNEEEENHDEDEKKNNSLFYVFFSVAPKFAGTYLVRQSREENPGEINREEGDRCRC